MNIPEIQDIDRDLIPTIHLLRERFIKLFPKDDFIRDLNFGLNKAAEEKKRLPYKDDEDEF